MAYALRTPCKLTVVGLRLALDSKRLPVADRRYARTRRGEGYGDFFLIIFETNGLPNYYIPKIMSKNNMQGALMAAVDALSRDPYGTDFAEWVWQRLLTLGALYRKHRDYCGIGLVYDATSGVASIVVVYDAGPVGKLLEFGNKEAFVAFFAQQSDFTLAGTENGPPELRAEAPQYVNNQRLNRAFLMGIGQEDQPNGDDT